MYALKGQREYQEDCGTVIELGELLILAIADGFNKPEERGSVVSRAVITELLACISAEQPALYDDTRGFMRTVFAHIGAKTKHHIAGSTLSLVVIDRRTHVATLGYVGDSVIALIDSEDDLHIHPMRQMRSRIHGLASAFGDATNAQFRADAAAVIVTHTLGPESVLIVSSDGLYPITPEDNVEQLEFLARHYIAMIREGGTPQSLANYASVNERSADNITVAVYQAEQHTATA